MSRNPLIPAEAGTQVLAKGIATDYGCGLRGKRSLGPRFRGDEGKYC